MLAWMLKKGFTKELPKNEMGYKRYSFTDEGKQFLEKQIALGKNFMKRIDFLAPMLIGGFNLGGNDKKFRESKRPRRSPT